MRGPPNQHPPMQQHFPPSDGPPRLMPPQPQQFRRQRFPSHEGGQFGPPEQHGPPSQSYHPLSQGMSDPRMRPQIPGPQESFHAEPNFRDPGQNEFDPPPPQRKDDNFSSRVGERGDRNNAPAIDERRGRAPRDRGTGRRPERGGGRRERSPPSSHRRGSSEKDVPPPKRQRSDKRERDKTDERSTSSKSTSRSRTKKD